LIHQIGGEQRALEVFRTAFAAGKQALNHEAGAGALDQFVGAGVIRERVKDQRR
jgi:hypothetical protein